MNSTTVRLDKKEPVVPFVRIDVAEGKSAEELTAIGDGVHAALIDAIDIPKDDRFQVINVVPSARLIYDRAYFDINRSDSTVFIQITLRPGRTEDQKRKIYHLIATQLWRKAKVRAEDVFITLVEIPGENWSFGGGVAQYAPSLKSE